MPSSYRRDFLVQRAGRRCEYCLFPEARLAMGLHVDHIIARQHGGGDEESNLAMACMHCNACKGPNLSSIDPLNNEIVRLFHPRTDHWHEHFALADDQIRGVTPIGRATTNLLDMNNPNRIQGRRLLRLLGIIITI